MDLAAFLSSVLWAVLVEIVAALALTSVTWVSKTYVLALRKRDPRLPFISVIIPIVCWLALNFLVFAMVQSHNPPWFLTATASVLLAAPLLLFFWTELNQFWSVGLRGADRRIRTGIDYEASLKLCQNEWAFLGTGDSKLTELREFEDALARCRQDRPVRFLLTKPTDENLTNAAKRARRPKDEYRQTVVTSLGRIADLRTRFKNIDVRFYPELPKIDPIFRLVFIDASICLMSYNVFGEEGAGAQLPQLHIVKGPERGRVVESFYYPMERYFEWLWDLSEPWDFREYLGRNGKHE